MDKQLPMGWRGMNDYEMADQSIRRAKAEMANESVADRPVFAGDASADVVIVVQGASFSGDGILNISALMVTSLGDSATFTMDLDMAQFSAAIINTRIRAEARSTAFNLWGITLSATSRIMLLGGAA